MYQESTDQLHSVTWRPHPPTLLKKDQLADVKIKMKDYSKRLEASDQAKRSARKAELQAKKAQIYKEFSQWAAERAEWIQTLPGYSEWEQDRQKWAEEHPTEETELETSEEISVTTKPTMVS